jgi:hypothetical protein
MRYSRNAAMVVAAVWMAAPSAPAQDALSEEGFEFFYDSLVPYGDWIRVGNYGPCWRPETAEDWAPYTEGYWAYTDVGWTWVSHEPFGSIVYHYGRWLLTDRGWCWVPGADWSPAWVSWRTGGDYVGWAPLPPEVPWHPQRGISTWVDVHTEIGPAYYRFCSVRDFTSPVLSGVLLRPSRNSLVMVRTENVTQITVRNSSVFCGGPRYDWVAENCDGRVPLLRVAREENVSRFRSLQPTGGGVQNIVHNNILVLPAPRRVQFNVSVQNFPAQSVNVSVSKGWYSNRSENERLRSHISREWEERRTPQSPPSAVRDPNGATVRLTPPTAAEKAALIGEIGTNPSVSPVPSVPSPVPAGGAGRPGKGAQGGFTQSDGRPLEVPKVQPVQTPSPPFPPSSQAAVQKNANPAGVETLPGVGTNRQSSGLPQQPVQPLPGAQALTLKPEVKQPTRDLPNPAGSGPASNKPPGGLTQKPAATQSVGGRFESSTGAGVGAQPLQSAVTPENLSVKRSYPIQTPDQNRLATKPGLPPSIAGQPPQSTPSGAELDPYSRNQPRPGTPKSAATGTVSQNFPLPNRPVSEAISGSSQPPISRANPALQQQPTQIQAPNQFRQPSASGGFPQSRESVQAPSSLPGASRSFGSVPPVQTAPVSRPTQSAASFEQPTRIQSPGVPQANRPVPSSSGTPSNSVGAGVSAGGRPSAPPAGAGIAPVPASSASQISTPTPGTTGQKKKPGDPGYIPGAP